MLPVKGSGRKRGRGISSPATRIAESSLSTPQEEKGIKTREGISNTERSSKKRSRSVALMTSRHPRMRVGLKNGGKEKGNPQGHHRGFRTGNFTWNKIEKRGIRGKRGEKKLERTRKSGD